MSELQPLLTQSRATARQLALVPATQKTAALMAMAKAVRAASADILAANAKDLAAANGLTPALRDRLLLNEQRIEAMAKGIEEIAAQPDPVGKVLEQWTRPNGLSISRITVPLGVIGIIYESRPNVTADAGALCLRSGNTCILRGGSESFYSSGAIVRALQQALRESGLPEGCIQALPSPDRALVGEMLAAAGQIDVIVPRGGKSLVARVQAESKVPVLAHLEGNNHVYVHSRANAAMAQGVLLNSKMRRTSVCGAAEKLLIDISSPLLRPLIKALLDAGCAVRGDATAQASDSRVTAATAQDWDTEYLDAIIAVKTVTGVDEAIAHINAHGSHHTDAIVTDDTATAQKFLREVDSALVLHNASTQFADGGEFGFGGEIGIATGRLHARGPVGAAQLVTYKYVLEGHGQTRP
jgi:glutamate-5-semialdehyde dehydrogenase